MALLRREKDHTDELAPRDRLERTDAITEARARFGGVDVPASFAGMLAALGLAAVLAGIATGAGSFGYQSGIDGEDMSFVGLIVGLGVLIVSFAFGGWVAGRMARYDGVRNGMLTAFWFVVLAAALSAVGAWLGDRYDFLADINLPQWFDPGRDTPEAVVTGVIAVVAMFIAAAMGGAIGARYHRDVDSTIVDVREHTRAEEHRELNDERDRVRR
jgi:hypothetical protein